MNTKKIIFNTNWFAWILFAIFFEIIVNGSLLSISFYLFTTHTDVWPELLAIIGLLSLGLPFLLLFEAKEYIVKKHKKKEKSYKIKNLFFLSKKEVKSGIDFHKLEKEL